LERIQLYSEKPRSQNASIQIGAVMYMLFGSEIAGDSRDEDKRGCLDGS